MLLTCRVSMHGNCHTSLAVQLYWVVSRFLARLDCIAPETGRLVQGIVQGILQGSFFYSVSWVRKVNCECCDCLPFFSHVVLRSNYRCSIVSTTTTTTTTKTTTTMTMNQPVNRPTKHKHRTKVNSIICLGKRRRGGRGGACGRIFHIFVVVVNLLFQFPFFLRGL